MSPSLLHRAPKDGAAGPHIPAVAGLEPPPPSRAYLNDRNYAGGRADLAGGTRARAFAAHRAWQARHGSITPDVHAWRRPAADQA